MDAADELSKRYGLSAEVVDLRTANPIDYAPLVESVKKTGKVMLACDAVERGCVMQTVAATITQLCFDDLDAPPVVVGSRNWITPAAELETMFFPQVSWILDADARADTAAGGLPGPDESDAGRTRATVALGRLSKRAHTRRCGARQ